MDTNQKHIEDQLLHEKSLKSNFKEILKAKILSGELKPGDKLPPERELAKDIGISRGSINQGILDLERMGFLKIIPRQGTFVAQYSKNATPETLAAIMSYDSTSINPVLFQDFMDFRTLIERECARLACIHLNSKNLVALNQATRAVHNATMNPSLSASEAVFNYHKCIVEISGNAAFFMVFQSFEKMMRNMIRMHYAEPQKLSEELQYFTEMTTAISHRDVYEADNLMYNLLKNASAYLDEQLKEKEKEKL